MSEIEINRKPKIFDDPEFCTLGGSSSGCSFINSNLFCPIFKEEIIKPEYEEYIIKHDECKKLYQEAKDGHF